jgi:galactofuranosylgalactofuranosylrhamnosyl-N-acetylglucosaminyl-diphospho-decaprenol beta-1,5/1,6-galactofuranosyltransferase
MLKADLRFLINLQYSTVELHHLAYRDFLAGPEALFSGMPASVVRAREVRATHADGQVLPSSADLPLPSMPTAKALRFRRIPVKPLQIGKTLVKALAHNARPVAPENLETPQLNLAYQDARWFLLSRLDSATVGTADGRGLTFRRRDPVTFRRLAATSGQLLRRMSAEFPQLQRRYRDAAGELTSMDRWNEAFEEWGYQRV